MAGIFLHQKSTNNVLIRSIWTIQPSLTVAFIRLQVPVACSMPPGVRFVPYDEELGSEEGK